MTTADEGIEASVPDPVAHNASRLRGPRRLLLAGVVAGFVVAFGAGALGADGRTGFLLLLLTLSVVFAATGLWVAVHLLVDQFRGEPTSLGRGLLAFVMFLATLSCLVAFGGVVANAGVGS